MPVEKKSVLIFCDLNSCGGGVYIYTQQLTKAFLQNNVSVYIISHEPKGTKEKEFLNPLTEGTTGHHLIPNNVSDNVIVESITCYASKIKPTWYIPNYREGAHAAMVPLKRIGVGNIFVCHNDHTSQYRYAARYQSVIDFFVCPSKKCEQYLLHKLNQSAKHRVTYIPHCVDIMSENSISKKSSSDPIKLLYSGRIDFEQKQLEYLPKIANALRNMGIDAEVNIVGDGKDRNELENLFREYELENIFFHGHIDRSKLRTHFEANDIVVLTSLYEGFCLALAEAMSFGLPAVAFDCGGVIDDYLIDNSNGYIVPFGDITEFANKIQLIASNAENYDRLSYAAGQKIREDFSWDRFSNNYRSLICSQNVIAYSWPRFRNTYIPTKRFSLNNLIEHTGKLFLNW